MPRIHTFVSIWILFWMFSLPFSIQAQSLQIEDIPLSEALKQVKSQYGVLIAFQEKAVAPYQVSFSGQNQPLETVLTSLLSQTNLEFRPLSAGQYIVAPRLEAPAPTRKPGTGRHYTLRGQVLDAQSGEPIVQASIHILGTNYGTYSGENGHFVLAGLPRQYDSLEVRYLGYRAQRLAWNSQRALRIRLEVDPHQLDDVMIYEGSDQVVTVADAASQLQINPRKIQALSGLGEPDLLRALQFLPGISSGDESSAGLHIRGGRPEENMFLFDGITVYQPGHLFGNFSAFNPEAVKELTVQRGGFDARYGGRISGIIDVKGRPEQMQEAKGSIGLNLMSSNVYGQIPFWKDKGAVMVSLRRSSSNLLQSSFYSRLTRRVIDSLHLSQQSSGQATLRQEPSFRFKDINAKVVLRPTDKDFLSLSAYLANDDLQYEWRDGIRQGEWFAQNEETLLENRGLAMNWKRQWNPRFISQANLAWSSFENLFRFQQYSNLLPENVLGWDQGNGIRDWTLRLDQELKLGRKDVLDFGVHASHFTLDSMLNFMGDGAYRNYRQQSFLLSAYGQYHWHPTEKLSLNLGGRANYYQGTDQLYLEPRLSFHYQWNKHFHVKGVWGHYHQFLNRTEMGNLGGLVGDYWTLADGDQMPVLRAEHFIVGAAYEANDWLLDLELYHKNLSGIISYIDAIYSIQDFEPVLYRGGSGIARGVDIMVQKKIDFYTSWISYSLSQVNYHFPELFSETGFPAAHDQRHQFSWVNLFNLGPWQLSLNWTFASGRPYTPAEEILSTRSIGGEEVYYVGYGEIHGARMNAYHRMDASVSYAIPVWQDKVSAKMGISLFNLYDRRNQSEILYRVRMPRSEDEQPRILRLEKNLLGVTPNFFLKVEF
jgi:ferric enterobactin receptor